MKTSFYKRMSCFIFIAALPIFLCSFMNYETDIFTSGTHGVNERHNLNNAAGATQNEKFKSTPTFAIDPIQEIALSPKNRESVNRDSIGNADCDHCLPLLRIEGTGNGMNVLNLSATTENEILNEPYYSEQAEYLFDGSPVEVRVIDPFHLPECEFQLSLSDSAGNFNAQELYWILENITTGQIDSSLNSFSTLSEDLLLDYGLIISWGQYVYYNQDGGQARHNTDFLYGDIEFADPLNPWLIGIPDEDGYTELNWIRAGTVETTTVDAPETETIYDDYNDGSDTEPYTDAGQTYENVINGTGSPYCLVAYSDEITVTDGPPAVNEWYNTTSPTIPILKGDISPPTFSNISNLKGLNNIDVVFTSDKSKWTRCPVLEMQPIREIADDDFNGAYGYPEKMMCRRHKSVDKNGRTSDYPGYNPEEGDLVSPWGMGWFPGYVIDVGTGERLNVAFGENSWLIGDNGNDMLFNPSNRLSGLGGYLFGGQHWIYVFKNIRAEMFDEYDGTNSVLGADTTYCPGYDEGRFLFSHLGSPTLSANNFKKVYRACTWVGSALSNPDIIGQVNGTSLLTPEQGLIPNTCRIRLRVAKPYAKANPSGGAQDAPGSLNQWRNLYYFSTIGSPISCPSLSSNLQQGLVGYWPFCGNANDESGNGNHGLVYGAVLAEDRFGNASAAYAFNGVNSFISVADNANGSLDVQAGEFSISCWTKVESEAFDSHGLVAKELGGNSSGDYSLTIASNGKAQLAVGVGSGIIGAVQQSESELTDASWQHVLAVYRNGSDMKIYINGQLDQGDNNLSTAIPNSNTPLDLIFGMSTNISNANYYLNGCLDDIAIWNRALTADEVQELYTLDAIGVESISKKTDLLLYPNPTSDQLTINYGNIAAMAGYSMSIFSSGGSTVHETLITQAQETLDISGWSSGVYQVVVYNAGGVPLETRQIVIQ